MNAISSDAFLRNVEGKIRAYARPEEIAENILQFQHTAFRLIVTWVNSEFTVEFNSSGPTITLTGDNLGHIARLKFELTLGIDFHGTINKIDIQSKHTNAIRSVSRCVFEHLDIQGGVDMAVLEEKIARFIHKIIDFADGY